VHWTIADVIRGQAEKRRNQPAFTFEDRTVTYGDLDDRSNRVAQALLAEGVDPQDRVAYIDKNSVEFFEVLFGVAKINAVNVAVNWRLAPAEMAQIVNDAGAKLLFVGEEFSDHLGVMREILTSVKRVIVMDRREASADEAYEAWLAPHGATDPGVSGGPEDVALQLYTSGTTGLPKGVMLTNSNLGCVMAEIPQWWDVDGDSVTLVCMPFFHIGGVEWALVGLHCGASAIMLRQFEPGQVLAALGSGRITNAVLVPAMMQMLIERPESVGRDFSPLRTVIYGASPITEQTLVAALETFGCDFIQGYGSTETTGTITVLPVEAHDPQGPRSYLLRSAGRPLPWIELRIVDPDTGEDRPRGETGELWTRSAQNMKGYWNIPEETATVLRSDGWLRTGDGGYLDQEGFVYLTDRIKDMIVTGAENVAPAEVELVLAGHPGVAEVAVIGVPHPKWGETVKAIIVPVPGTDVAADDVVAFARQRLATFKCPTSIEFVTELPRNLSGKVLKRDLRNLYAKAGS
jgi:acyl-CoA synthetase (AMP-forming)/AMP-acid ligase II